MLPSCIQIPFQADPVSHWNHRKNKETQVWWRGSRAVGSTQTMSLSLMQITHAHGEIITRATQPDCLMCSNYHVRTSRRKAETVRYGARRDYGRPHDLLSVEQSQLRGKQLAWAARRPCWHGYCGCGKVVPDGTRQPPIRRDDQTQSGFMKKVNRRPNWSVTGQGVSSVAAVRVLAHYHGSDSEDQQLEELEKDDSVMDYSVLLSLLRYQHVVILQHN